MGEKGFFGATRSEINRMKNEVNKDYGLSKGTKKKKRKARRKKR